MKTAIFTATAILSFGFAIAQQDPKAPHESKSRTATDTSTAVKLTTPESLKKSDAVKTDDHAKPVPKVSKDTATKPKRR